MRFVQVEKQSGNEKNLEFKKKTFPKSFSGGEKYKKTFMQKSEKSC